MRGLPFFILIIIIAGGVVYFTSNQNPTDSNTGALVTSFSSCVNAGNEAVGSFPQQCTHDGVVFIEDVSAPDPNEDGTVLCEASQRGAFCTQQYEPVCGLTQVECITTPCDPVPQSFGNACTACSNERVLSYTEGVCNFF